MVSRARAILLDSLALSERAFRQSGSFPASTRFHIFFAYSIGPSPGTRERVFQFSVTTFDSKRHQHQCAHLPCYESNTLCSIQTYFGPVAPRTHSQVSGRLELPKTAPSLVRSLGHFIYAAQADFQALPPSLHRVWASQYNRKYRETFSRCLS